MTRFIPVIRALSHGRGVSFRVDYPHKLIITASSTVMNRVDLSTLKDNKHLFINSLPVGYTVTTEQILKAIEDYKRNIATMREQGHTGQCEADAKALPLMREYIRSLVT